MTSSERTDSPQGSARVDGVRLRKLRQFLGLTQEEAASRAGFSDRLIRKLEQGGPVRRKTLIAVVESYRAQIERIGPPPGDTAIVSADFIVPEVKDLRLLANEWFDRAFNQRDLSVVGDLMHENVRVVAEGKTLAGRVEVRKRVAKVLAGFNPLRVTIENVFSLDSVVIVYWKMDKTHSGKFFGIAPTGHQASIRGNSMARFWKGKIIEFREHWDIHDLLHQLAERAV